MSDIEEADRLEGTPHPREVFELVGHAEAENSVLAAWQSGRLPHALLIGGPEGIGKATLAYRIARFLLSAPDRNATTLAVDPEHQVSRQIVAQSHPDLLALRRVSPEEGKKAPSEIPADMVRKTVPFFGSTAARGGYRVCIVDSAEELNRFGANSLLKILEEPPPNSLLIIVSHSPGRLLPTIRSRCRRILLRPLEPAQIVQAIENIADRIPELPRADVAQASKAGSGSVRRAIQLLLAEGLEVRSLTIEMLNRLPQVDSGSLSSLSDKIQRERGLEVFSETVEDWLALSATDTEGSDGARLARYAETWEKVRRAAVEAEAFNLDRRPLVFQVFSMLAEAARNGSARA